MNHPSILSPQRLKELVDAEKAGGKNAAQAVNDYYAGLIWDDLLREELVSKPFTNPVDGMLTCTNCNAQLGRETGTVFYYCYRCGHNLGRPKLR